MTFAESFRDLKRISQVVNVLFRNGMGYFIREFNLKLHLSLPKKFAVHRYAKPSKPEVMLRKSMEQLGGSFIKLGQLLSVRPDLVPLGYCREFSKLQDKVKPFSFDSAKKIIESEMGEPLSKVFSKFEKNPIGSASIAQVHLAKLKNGKKVVVKVQRPGINKVFEADLDLIRYFAGKMEQSERIGRYSPSRIVEEFERYTKKELNFLIEASNIEKFYANFKNSKAVKIPKVYGAFSTPKVLVLEHIQGEKLVDLINKKKKFDGKKAAKQLIAALVTMIFEHGIFHADLHPGNILVTKNGVGILDFGIVGRMKPEYKREGLKLYVALINEDTDAIIRQLRRVGKESRDTNIDSFKRDVENVMSEWYGKQLKHARFTHLLHRLFDVCFDHGIQIPTDLVLFGKAMVTAEGTGLQIYPSFNMANESEPYFKKYMRKTAFSAETIKRLASRSQEIADFLERLPAETLRTLEKLREGRVKIDVEDTDIKHLGLEIDRSSNRLAYAMVIAALVIGGAWTMQAEGPAMDSYPVVSIAFFFIALALSTILVVSIYREGKTRY